MGLPIVNQSYHTDGRALWVMEKMMRQEVDKSSFAHSLTLLMYSDIFTIYVPRAFQPIFSKPLILQHTRKAIQSVRLGWFIAIFDIRSRWSSHDWATFSSWSAPDQIFFYKMERVVSFLVRGFKHWSRFDFAADDSNFKVVHSSQLFGLWRTLAPLWGRNLTTILLWWP